MSDLKRLPLPEDFPMLRTGDAVQHKISGMLGRVERFADPDWKKDGYDHGTDIWVDGTGPYPQGDFRKLVAGRGEPGAPAREDGSCSCQTFSECTHK